MPTAEPNVSGAKRKIAGTLRDVFGTMDGGSGGESDSEEAVAALPPRRALTPEPSPGRVPTRLEDAREGDRVEAYWGNRYWPATVVGVQMASPPKGSSPTGAPERLYDVVFADQSMLRHRKQNEVRVVGSDQPPPVYDAFHTNDVCPSRVVDVSGLPFGFAQRRVKGTQTAASGPLPEATVVPVKKPPTAQASTQTFPVRIVDDAALALEVSRQLEMLQGTPSRRTTPSPEPQNHAHHTPRMPPHLTDIPYAAHPDDVLFHSITPDIATTVGTATPTASLPTLQGRNSPGRVESHSRQYSGDDPLQRVRGRTRRSPPRAQTPPSSAHRNGIASVALVGGGNQNVAGAVGTSRLLQDPAVVIGVPAQHRQPVLQPPRVAYLSTQSPSAVPPSFGDQSTDHTFTDVEFASFHSGTTESTTAGLRRDRNGGAGQLRQADVPARPGTSVASTNSSVAPSITRSSEAPSSRRTERAQIRDPSPLPAWARTHATAPRASDMPSKKPSPERDGQGRPKQRHVVDWHAGARSKQLVFSGSPTPAHTLHTDRAWNNVAGRDWVPL